MKGVKTLRLFYNGKCIRPMSEGKEINVKTSDRVLIAKYKFDCSKADLFPEFNEGFEYIFVDEQVDERDVMSINRETVTVMTYDAEPDEYGVLTTEYEVETPVLINAGDIVTRSIYSNELPTQIIFGSQTISDRERSLLEIIHLSMTNVINMGYMFCGCSNLTKIHNSKWNIKNVTFSGSAFRNCSSLVSLDVSDWDTSNINNMHYMFANCRLLTSLDLSNFDTSKVTNISYMFANNTSLENLNIANFDLNKTTGLSNLLTGCDKLDYIDCSNVDAYSVKMISGLLLNRVNQTAGTIVCKTVLETDTLNTLSSRNWNVDTIGNETSYFILGKSKLGQAKLK